MREGRLTDAQVAFRASIELVPRVSSAFNLALSLRGTGDFVEADRTLAGLLAESFGLPSAAQRERSESLRAEVAAAIGQVRITMRGAPRARVRVDGLVVGALEDGGTLTLRVDPGERLITAAADRYATAETRVQITDGGSEDLMLQLELTEEASRGRIVLEAAEPSHIVEILGVVRARGRVERALAPGRYRVALLHGDTRQESEVELEAGQTLLLPLAPADDEPLVTSPWLWLGVGALAVGLVVTGIVLFVPVDEHQPDDTWGITTALR